MKYCFSNLLALTFSYIFFLPAFGQTSVSGGIYSNTTWTKANSPYIVTDTIVVFPNVTLTIEPGVTIKFTANKMLESRQGRILAVGASNNQITFTSNAAQPNAGSWSCIRINGGNLVSQFTYCRFEYAKVAIYNNHLSGNQNTTATTEINNSVFSNNERGTFCIGNGGGYTTISNSMYNNNVSGAMGSNFVLDNCLCHDNVIGVDIHPYYNTYSYINNCTLYKNHYGLASSHVTDAAQYTIRNSSIICNTIAGIALGQFANIVDTIYNCLIKNNPIGILDSFGSGLFLQKCIIEANEIGLRLKESNKQFTCNKIANNLVWDVYCAKAFGSTLNIPNNDWSTSNTSTISTKIYDGYDNFNLSIVNFSPVDSVQCFSAGVTNPVDTFQCQVNGCNTTVSVTVSNASCGNCSNGSATAAVSYGVQPITYTWNTSPIQTSQTAQNLPPGSYTICVSDANGCTACVPFTIDSINCSGFSISIQATSASCNSCNDGSAQVTGIGGTTPYYYTWYTSPMQTTPLANALTNGVYLVCVNDANGCDVCDSAVINIGTCSSYFSLYPDSAPHVYTAVNMADGNGPLTYVWNWGDGSIDSIAYPSHTYANPGLYNICLTITDTTGCSSTYCSNYYLLKNMDNIIQVNVTSYATNIDIFSNEPHLEIYPNPATSSVVLTVSKKLVGSTASIIDITGKKIVTVKIEDAQSVLSTQGLYPGVYFLSVVDNMGPLPYTRKLLIQK